MCHLTSVHFHALYLEHRRWGSADLHQFSHVCWCVVGHSYGLELPLGMQLLQCGPTLSSVPWKESIINQGLMISVTQV